MTKTVFFGPFIGEFAWEIMHWQGWIRKVCAEQFKDHRKIASSFTGRAGLYPNVDEFWPVPDSFQVHVTNSVQYIVKGWRHGLPGSKELRAVPEKVIKDGAVSLEYRYEEVYEAAEGPDIEPQATAMYEDMKQRLPNDTICFTPQQNRRRWIGIRSASHRPSAGNHRPPTPSGKKAIDTGNSRQRSDSRPALCDGQQSGNIK